MRKDFYFSVAFSDALRNTRSRLLAARLCLSTDNLDVAAKAKVILSRDGQTVYNAYSSRQNTH